MRFAYVVAVRRENLRVEAVGASEFGYNSGMPSAFLRVVSANVQRGLCACLVVLPLLQPACGKKSAEVDAATQKELAARRDQLMAARRRLVEDKAKLEAEIKTVEASGGDASTLKNQLAAINSKMETELSQLVADVSAKVDAINTVGGKEERLAAREADLARREADLARREADLAKRGGSAAAPGPGVAGNGDERDAKLLAQIAALADKCGAGAPPMIVQTVAPKGSNYSRAEVEPLLSKARAGMLKKGLLTGDLPGQVQGLESEATKAMADGDWGKAYLAAAQFAGTVEAIKVDRAFVTAKYNRLNSRVSAQKLDDGKNQQMSKGMQDVMEAFGNGDFAAANRKLNQLAAAL